MADFPDRSHWQVLSQQLSMPGQAFIDGCSTDAASGARFDCISPIDGRVLGAVADCDAQDVERAVLAARRAFEAGHWSSQRTRGAGLAALVEHGTAALLPGHGQAVRARVPGGCLGWTASGGAYGENTRTRWRAGNPGHGQMPVARRAASICPLRCCLAGPPKRVTSCTAKSHPPACMSWGWSRASLPAWWRRSCRGISAADGLLEDRTGAAGATVGQPSAAAPAACVLARRPGRGAAVFRAIPTSGLWRRWEPAAAIWTWPKSVASSSTRAKSAPPARGCWYSARSRGFRAPGGCLRPTHAAPPSTGRRCTDGGAGRRRARGQGAGRYRARRRRGRSPAAGRASGRRGSRRLLCAAHGVRPGADHALAREEVFGPVLAVLGFEDEAEAVRVANDSHGLAAGLWTRPGPCPPRRAPAACRQRVGERLGWW